MRVLLISPLAGLDPASGDVTYTESLLRHPPSGVEYVSYSDAIEAGELSWIGSRSTFRPEGVDIVTAVRASVARRLHSHLSRRRLAFREPVLTARVTGNFDLVHVHVFNVGFVGVTPPLVYSNACPTQVLYADAERWGARRLRLAETVQGMLARLAKSRLISARPLPDAVWVLFTRYLTEFYADLGVDLAKMYVAPNWADVSMPDVPKRPNVIGFCAKSFKDKGGEDVLAAFELLRRTNPGLELEMVGHARPEGVPETAGVRWLGYVPRERLLAEVLPSWSALLYPTRFDGSPYAVIEAMGVGCPVVTVPYGALPEMVPDGVAGCVAKSYSPGDLADAISEVLRLNASLAIGARRWFEERFAPGPAHEVLYDAYTAAVARSEPGAPSAKQTSRNDKTSG